MPQIHPTAIVAPGAMLAEDVAIGPYCTVGENVTLGPRVKLISHAVVDGRTYVDPAFLVSAETYHAAVLKAHQDHARVEASLPSDHAWPPEQLATTSPAEPPPLSGSPD